jgi:hypothetical protein
VVWADCGPAEQGFRDRDDTPGSIIRWRADGLYYCNFAVIAGFEDMTGGR